MSDLEYLKAKRWEGKSFLFKTKYLLANYPEVAAGAFIMAVICPIIIAYRTYNYPGSRYDSLRKFKTKYTVVRDDDPNLEKIMEEKNLGREHFPKY